MRLCRGRTIQRNTTRAVKALGDFASTKHQVCSLGRSEFAISPRSRDTGDSLTSDRDRRRRRHRRFVSHAVELH